LKQEITAAKTYGAQLMRAAPAIIEEQDGAIVGNNRIYWKDGFMYHNRNPKNENGINGWAEGGSCMIDREKFLDLHGFDQLYAPFYWEDIDLSYRAWKSGYDVLFNADILVEHHHQSTIGKYFDSKKVTSITFRNQLLFIWKNINTGSFLSKHFGSLCILLAKQLLKGDTVYLAATFQALIRLPAALSSRSSYRISDTEILNKFI
jgi:GT2 family glycosyltransferase